ncbi:LPS-assembly protein LptD [Arcobacter aquimarinus]|uniref:Lipooligosaccharide transport system, OM translocon component LptD n=1 Tax=Arcobacter aquimarinus TaxID=1315211 RepID=A0AAE7B3V6_9BACT|nr:LPS assembly protein LptD [Arcobacter aquimarinus]QKE25986.1 lipooligosaccharide transport system, OM translocon component LptD [Arcobacter aquimarinus]RXI36645.1 organic solvent tolerance protein [Arcobacter aquimarinus]
MYKKIISTLVITSALLQAQEIKNEKFQLVAEDLKSKENVLTATGNVVIFSPTYYLSADKAIYHKESEIFELFDNVLIIKDNNIQTQSNYAFVDLKTDSLNQEPTFLYENSSKLWVNSKESSKNNELVELDNSIISSCDCIDPAWSIRASSIDYDTEKKWVDAYNPRLYVKNVPILYSPYLGFPTDTTRRTGLLLPTVGYSGDEGIYYSQPIFIAPADNYDIELIPQIRTFRGNGIYAHYRYADSVDSILRVKAGVFKEYKDYKEKNNLENNEHFGLDINYIRRNIFSNSNTSDDGLYSSLRYLNDVEYITLEDEDAILSTDKKVESKINYFYNTPDYYTGAYARYYIDTSKKSNNQTLQELPQLHFHSYNKELFLDGLLYSIDTKFMNYTRPEGLTASIYEVSVPISYSKYFLDDYLYFTVENKTLLSKYKYGNIDKIKYEDGTLIQNRTSFLVGSDLIKPYEDYLHTMNLTSEYIIPKNLKEDGDLYGATIDKTSQKGRELKAFPIIEEDKNIVLTLNQSLYDKDSLKQIINHKMSQSIFYDELDNPKLQNYENYLKINHDYGSISGRAVYNVQDEQFIESSVDKTLTYRDLSFSAGYYESKETENSNKEDLESYRFSASYKIAKDYSIRYYENYNLKEKVRNRQGIGFNIDDSCWNLDLSIEREIEPTTRIDYSNNYKSIEQDIILVNLTLKPIGGVKYKHKIENNEE